jgi:hypothetical protein
MPWMNGDVLWMIPYMPWMKGDVGFHISQKTPPGIPDGVLYEILNWKFT